MTDLIMIDPITKDDYLQWYSLWTKYNHFYGRDSFPDEITQLTWSRFFDDNEPVYALVAKKDEEIFGIAHYLFHRSTTQIGPNCYLQDLYIDESMRCRGIASQLIGAVCENAKIAGSRRVYWQTKEDNLVARKLYDKVAAYSGFIVYSRDL